MGSPMNPQQNSDSPMVLLRRLHRWRMAFFGVTILLAGAIGGAAATLLTLRYVGQRVPPAPEFVVERMLDRLSERLHLTPEQVQQARGILLKHVQKLRGIWEEGRTAIIRELEVLDQDMSRVLDKDQEQLWHQLHEPLARPFRRGPFRRGLGPGGWVAPPGDRGGPASASPNRPPPPDANAAQHR
jgi:hypothetical protein